MAVAQIRESFQNDGNFSQLDLQDIKMGGPIMRIETFRCSQPKGDFGITSSGTAVEHIAGEDHLSSHSNRIFRHIFSSSVNGEEIALIEIRETYDEDGSFEVRMRDIDVFSETFGYTLITKVKPDKKGMFISYKVKEAYNANTTKITSPIKEAVSHLGTNLVDICSPTEELGASSEIKDIELLLTFDFHNEQENQRLDEFATSLRAKAPQWTKNVILYERMGDFRDKCIHTGENLIGNNPQLASEYILIRAYRMSLIAVGRVFDSDMVHGLSLNNMERFLECDPKPGVYNAFLSAFAFNISHYQMGLDKVHSDYGGIPMRLKPGSRLENGNTPIVDATNVNRALAILSGLFYAPSSLESILSVEPAIKTIMNKEPLQSYL